MDDHPDVEFCRPSSSAELTSVKENDEDIVIRNSETERRKKCLQCNEFDQQQSMRKDVPNESDITNICLCSLNNHNNNNNFNPPPTAFYGNYHHYNYQYNSYHRYYFEQQQNFEAYRYRYSMRLDQPGRIYNYLNQCRRWIKVWEPPAGRPKPPEFSITTYNILAQNLLLNHLYLYQRNQKSDLKWLERCFRLKQEFSRLESDIYCFQEVHTKNFTSSLLPFLQERGYEHVLKQKTGDNLDGCAILYKRDRFQLQESRELQFLQPEISPLLNRDQVALMVKLKPIGSLSSGNNSSLVVATTHLLFNPKRGDIKLAQLRLLLAELQRFSVVRRSNSDIPTGDPWDQIYRPIILAGDFNCEPHSPLIRFIQTGQLNIKDLKCGDISGQREGLDRGRNLEPKDLYMRNIDLNSCFTTDPNTEPGDDMTVRHIFDFRSAYPTIDEYNRPLISTSTAYDYGLVDYLFYSYRHRNIRLSAFKQLMNTADLAQIGGYLPNSIQGSDHIPLSAKFYLM